MLEETAPSQAVTTIIESLPKTEAKEDGVKKLRRRKKRKTLARLPRASKTQETPDTEKRHTVWFSTIANLALLIAIFTIIFAAHRAIQNSRQPPIARHQEVTAQQPVQTEEQQSGVTAEQQNNAITSEPIESIKTEPVKNEEQKIEALAQEIQTIEPVKPKVSLERPTIRRNPWNDGGILDLDSETARQEYKNKGYLSSTESDTE